MFETKAIKPLTTYYGGKSVRLARIIVSKMTAHRIYCEPFFGMGGVLFAKRPSEVEIVNDLSDGLVNLFKVVRDPELCQELIRRLELTPYAWTEWKGCQTAYNVPSIWEQMDKVEQARCIYVALSQSFNGTFQDGWSFGGYKHDTNVARTFYNNIANIPAVAMRLRTVQIECNDALHVMRLWDGPDTLFYLDPPYVLSSRSQKTKGRRHYKHEMEDDQHQELLDFCLQSKAKIILSGYQSKLYDDALSRAGWLHETFDAFATSAVYTDGNGLKGKNRELSKRTEVLWFSQNASLPTLWDFEREVI